MPNYRHNFSRIFAIFFVIAVPFIVIYSLGFDLNLANRKLNNTISINIETLPRGADIINQGKKILETPQELKAKDNQTIPIEIKLDGYQPENFLVWASPDQNTSARITKLSLLPQKNDEIAKFENVKNLTFLSDSYLLAQRDNKFFVQQYAFTGAQGNLEEVKLTGIVTEITSNNWVNLGQNAFWNPKDNLVLNKNESTWTLTNLAIFPNSFSSLVVLEQSTFLALDTNNLLWQLNLEVESFIYLEDNIQNLTSTQTPNNVWLRKDNNLIRLNRGIQDVNNFILTDKIYSVFPEEISLIPKTVPAWKRMTLESLNQGLLVQIEQNLYYIPDYEPNEWIKLANNAQVYETSGNSLFWIDDQKIVHTYNLYLKEWNTIATLKLDENLENVKLSYYSSWNRIFVHTPNKVIAIWFDKEIYNKNILGYYTVEWINEANCYNRIVDRYQFCTKDSKLITYKNLSLW